MSHYETAIDELGQTCDVYRRTRTRTGKNATESWSKSASNVPCLKLTKNEPMPVDTNNTTNATRVRVRFCFKKAASINLHDRISFEGRMYEIYEINSPPTSLGVHHKVAFCDVITGS